MDGVDCLLTQKRVSISYESHRSYSKKRNEQTRSKLERRRTWNCKDRYQINTFPDQYFMKFDNVLDDNVSFSLLTTYTHFCLREYFIYLFFIRKS